MTEPLQTSPSVSLSTPALSTPADDWIEVKAAAALKGVAERTITRLCGDAWLSEGKARLFQEPGKKPRWQVRRDVDPAFVARPANAAAMPVEDLRQYSKKQRDVALSRKVILDRWQKHLAAAQTMRLNRKVATERFVKLLAAEPGVETVCTRTLYNWLKDFNQEGIVGLMDGRGTKDRSTNRADDPFLKAVERFYLDQRKRSALLCYEMAVGIAAEMGWEVSCRYRTAKRHLDGLKAGVVIAKREGDSAFTNKIEPHIDRDTTTLTSNELWNADHHQFDVLVKIGERLNTRTGELEPIHARPWISGWQDVRSRKIVGLLIRTSDPNTDAVLESFRRGCLSHGVPANVLTDNGKDYDSQVFTGETKAARIKRRKVHVEYDMKKMGGIYSALGIKHHHAEKEHGQSKHIERFFGTICRRFARLWETYTGSSPQDKPEDLPQKLAAGKAPTLEEFVEAFEEWLEVDYHQKGHTGQGMEGMRPADVWEANLVTKRTAPEQLLEVLLQRRVGPRTVGQQGVAEGGIEYGKYDLGHLFGQKVYLRINDNDVSKVSVWTEDDKFLCVVTANAMLPVLATREQTREALAEKRRYSRILKDAGEARMRIHDNIPEIMLRAQAAKAKAPAAVTPPHDPTPPSVKAVRSDLERQLSALQNAQERPLKKAVGDGVMAGIDRFDLVSATDDISLAGNERTPATSVPSLLQLVGEE